MDMTLEQALSLYKMGIAVVCEDGMPLDMDIRKAHLAATR